MSDQQDNEGQGGEQPSQDPNEIGSGGASESEDKVPSRSFVRSRVAHFEAQNPAWQGPMPQRVPYGELPPRQQNAIGSGGAPEYGPKNMSRDFVRSRVAHFEGQNLAWQGPMPQRRPYDPLPTRVPGPDEDTGVDSRSVPFWSARNQLEARLSPHISEGNDDYDRQRGQWAFENEPYHIDSMFHRAAQNPAPAQNSYQDPQQTANAMMARGRQGMFQNFRQRAVARTAGVRRSAPKHYRRIKGHVTQATSRFRRAVSPHYATYKRRASEASGKVRRGVQHARYAINTQYNYHAPRQYANWQRRASAGSRSGTPGRFGHAKRRFSNTASRAMRAAPNHYARARSGVRRARQHISPHAQRFRTQAGRVFGRPQQHGPQGPPSGYYPQNQDGQDQFDDQNES